MESSSSDSFLWTDASNDFDDTIRNKTVQLTERDYVSDLESRVNYRQMEPVTNNEQEIQHSIRKKKKTKKRKCSEATQESSDCSQPERKRIKLEPENDMEIGKKNTIKKEKHVHNNDPQDSILKDDDFLNFRIKQEQFSYSEIGKKEKNKTPKKTYSTADDVSMENNTESYLDMRVKEEQASVVEYDIIKRKKKKKRKKSIGSSDGDFDSETKSTLNVSDHEANTLNTSSVCTEQSKYYAIEEKFTAEETVVEKRKKKKHQIDSIIKTNSEDNNDSLYIQKNSEVCSDKINNHDTSLQPSDFTCNNIVSSTIINNSAMDLEDQQLNKTNDLARNKHVGSTKISDRIRFEDDDNSNLQDSEFSKTSNNINMLLKLNPNLKVFAPKAPKDSIITKDDDIWVITLPHDIDLEMLRNTTVFSEGKRKIKINGETYEGVPNEDMNTITLLTHHHGQAVITNLPVKDCKNYRKRIPTIHIPNNNIMVNNQTNFIPLPETKCRHPLFGAHYKKAIKIPRSVAERLQAARERCSDSEPEPVVRKKHKRDKHKARDIKVEEYLVHNVKTEGEPLQRKKKRKHSEEESAPPKKVGRVKVNADCPTVWESEKAIEENLFNF